MISFLRSEVTKKLLSYLFLIPETSLYLNELQKKLDLDKRNLVKKLIELENEGVLRAEKKGRTKLYSINKNYPLLMRNTGIFSGKLLGLKKELKTS